MNKPFDFYGPGEIVAWSRILDDEELLCVLNANGTGQRGADVMVDAELNSGDTGTMTVVLNSAQVIDTHGFSGSHAAGSEIPVSRTADGRAFVSIRNVLPGEIIILANHP